MGEGREGQAEVNGAPVRVTATMARRQLADLANRVAFGGERIVVVRRGKAVAALVSIDDLLLLRWAEEQEDRVDLDEVKRRATDGEPLVSWDEVKRELGLEEEGI